MHFYTFSYPFELRSHSNKLPIRVKMSKAVAWKLNKTFIPRDNDLKEVWSKAYWKILQWPRDFWSSAWLKLRATRKVTSNPLENTRKSQHLSRICITTQKRIVRPLSLFKSIVHFSGYFFCKVSTKGSEDFRDSVDILSVCSLSRLSNIFTVFCVSHFFSKRINWVNPLLTLQFLNINRNDHESTDGRCRSTKNRLPFKRSLKWIFLKKNFYLESEKEIEANTNFSLNDNTRVSLFEKRTSSMDVFLLFNLPPTTFGFKLELNDQQNDGTSVPQENRSIKFGIISTRFVFFIEFNTMLKCYIQIL